MDHQRPDVRNRSARRARRLQPARLGRWGRIHRPKRRRGKVASYEAIADDPRATLAVVVAQIQEQTALQAGVPPERIISFPDQQTAAEAVRAGQADASASTAPGNRAYLHGAADPTLSFVPDTPSSPRAGLPVGAFSFAKTTPQLTDAVNASLDRYLGTKQHLEMMSRYGFTSQDLAPVL